jgi:hypothetical protein
MPRDPGILAGLVLLVVLLLAFVAILAVIIGPLLWRENGCLNRYRRRASSESGATA